MMFGYRSSGALGRLFFIQEREPHFNNRNLKPKEKDK
jgi:hypothetical protein